MTTPIIDKSQLLTGEQPHPTSSLAVLAAIVLFAAITPTILMTAPAVAAQLASQWQLSPSQIGDLFSTELGAMSLATLPAFWWLKRVDWRRAALLAGALFIVANLLSIWAQGYGALLALRFCSALAGGSLMIICLSSAASTANPSRTYGLWVMGQLVVGAIGLSILPRLFEHYGLAACYLLLALLMSLCLPLARYFPQGAPPRKNRGAGSRRAEVAGPVRHSRHPRFLYQPQRGLDLYRFDQRQGRHLRASQRRAAGRRHGHGHRRRRLRLADR